jgi:hypothetical protein
VDMWLPFLCENLGAAEICDDCVVNRGGQASENVDEDVGRRLKKRERKAISEGKL